MTSAQIESGSFSEDEARKSGEVKSDIGKMHKSSPDKDGKMT
jgi:hypothetical protein